MSEAAPNPNGRISAFELSEERLMGRFPSFNTAAGPAFTDHGSPDDNTAETATDAAQAALGRLIHLPQPEPIPGTPASEDEEVRESAGSNRLPPTEMDHAKARQIMTDTKLSQKDRIEQLLTLAYRGGGVFESSIPATLRARITNITENLADWYEGSEEYIETLIRERTAIQDIYDATDGYQTIPFLRNAADINDASWNHNQGDIGKRTELAARLIILEAIRA